VPCEGIQGATQKGKAARTVKKTGDTTASGGKTFIKRKQRDTPSDRTQQTMSPGRKNASLKLTQKGKIKQQVSQESHGKSSGPHYAGGRNRPPWQASRRGIEPLHGDAKGRGRRAVLEVGYSETDSTYHSRGRGKNARKRQNPRKESEMAFGGIQGKRKNSISARYLNSLPTGK